MLLRLVLTCCCLLSPLCAAETGLRLGTDEWPPYEYRAEDGQVTGFATELIRAALAFSQLPIESLEIYPWARLERDARQGALDLIFTLNANPERQQYLHFPSEPLDQDRGILFVRRDHPAPRVDGIQSLESLNLGVVRGYGYNEAVRALLTRSERVVEVSNESQLFNLLARGRVDAVISYYNVGQAMIKRLQLDHQVLALTEPVLFDTAYYAAFSRKSVSQETVEQFSAALRHYKQSPDYQALRSRYFPDAR